MFVLCLMAIVAVGNLNKAKAQAAAASAAPAVPAITPPDLCALVPVPTQQRDFCALKKAAEATAAKASKCTTALGVWDATKRPQCDFSEEEKANCEAGLVDSNSVDVPGSKGVWNTRGKSCVFDGTRPDTGFCLPASAVANEAPREVHNEYECWVLAGARKGPAGGGLSAKAVDKKIAAAIGPVERDLGVLGQRVVAVESWLGEVKKGHKEAVAAQHLFNTAVRARIEGVEFSVNGRDEEVPPPASSPAGTPPEMKHVWGLQETVHGRDIEVTESGQTRTIHEDGVLDVIRSHRAAMIGLRREFEGRGLLFSIGPAGFLASGGELNVKVGDQSRLVRGSYLRGVGLTLGLDYLSGPSMSGAFVSVSSATTDGASAGGGMTTFDGSAVVVGAQYLRRLDSNWALGGFAAFQSSRAGSLLLAPRASGMGVLVGIVGRGTLALGEESAFRLMVEPKVGIGAERSAAAVAVADKSQAVSEDGFLVFGSVELKLGYRP